MKHVNIILEYQFFLKIGDSYVIADTLSQIFEVYKKKLKLFRFQLQ